MKDNSPNSGLKGLAKHLASRREALLVAWSHASENDPELTAPASLSRIQLYDHMPHVLESFEHILESHHDTERSQCRSDQKANASEHGLHRWHHGYRLREVIREWGHMHIVLLEELESYFARDPDMSQADTRTARQLLAQLHSDGVAESAQRYTDYEQVDAKGRLRDLELALQQIQTMERQRAEFWREAAHDLRGNLGVVRNATTLLVGADISDPVRNEYLDILDRNVESLNVLLTDLMTLARLEAGQERRRIEQFDAAAVLSELCANHQLVARERGLFLKTEGPSTLPVEGDFIRTRRIAQNLVHNAIKYTEHGGVKVVWQVIRHRDKDHWALCVEDTGPGFDDGPVTPLARLLKHSTEESQKIERSAELRGEPPISTQPIPTIASESNHRPSLAGEGVGLSIVKRLCELLDASLEVKTRLGHGSTFRVIFPIKYPQQSSAQEQ